MKTPLEVIDDAIARLTAIRAIIQDPSVASETQGWMPSTSPVHLHLWRPVEQTIYRRPAEVLARALGGSWVTSRDGTWSLELPEGRIFIHNAEPARNPQPEAVEL